MSVRQVQTMYGLFNCWDDDLITNHLEQFSAHTRNELAMISSVIRAGDNLIDVGAHIGTFAIPFAHFNEGQGRIYAFEANSDNHALLTSNIEANGLEGVVVPVNAIVSTGHDRFEMSAPADRNSGMFFFTPSQAEGEGVVGVVGLDEWFEREDPGEIRMVKVDVEGAELLVLRSGREIIESSRPLLYIEVGRSHLERFGCSVAELDAFLATYGYHLFRNIGARNSASDDFRIARMSHVRDGGEFFDLLAIHPDDSRYPAQFSSPAVLRLYRARTMASALTRDLRSSVTRQSRRAMRTVRRAARRLFPRR